jgi:hypothetical protein
LIHPTDSKAISSAINLAYTHAPSPQGCNSVKIILLPATVLVILSGCAVMVPGHLYPVQGPLSKESTPPIYAVTLNGSFLPSGSVTVHIAPGITCPGDWKAISQDDPTARQMSAQWDDVYGSGYFVANVLGKRTFARAVLTCTNAAKLNLEFLVVEPGKPSSTVGVVSDGMGNIFKLSF